MDIKTNNDDLVLDILTSCTQILNQMGDIHTAWSHDVRLPREIEHSTESRDVPREIEHSTESRDIGYSVGTYSGSDDIYNGSSESRKECHISSFEYSRQVGINQITITSTEATIVNTMNKTVVSKVSKMRLTAKIKNKKSESDEIINDF